MNFHEFALYRTVKMGVIKESVTESPLKNSLRMPIKI